MNAAWFPCLWYNWPTFNVLFNCIQVPTYRYLSLREALRYWPAIRSGQPRHLSHTNSPEEKENGVLSSVSRQWLNILVDIVDRLFLNKLCMFLCEFILPQYFFRFLKWASPSQDHVVEIPQWLRTSRHSRSLAVWVASRLRSHKWPHGQLHPKHLRHLPGLLYFFQNGGHQRCFCSFQSAFYGIIV